MALLCINYVCLSIIFANVTYDYQRLRGMAAEIIAGHFFRTQLEQSTVSAALVINRYGKNVITVSPTQPSDRNVNIGGSR